MKKADGSSEARPKKKKVKKDEIPAETAEVQAPAAEAEEAAVSEKEEA
jgi:hypothetical protein